MRKSTEMTPAEIQYANDCLPSSFGYDHELNCIVSITDRGGQMELPMKYVKLLTDHLTSINIEPYGKTKV